MTDHIWPKRVGILGVGLLGGSVAKALKRHDPAVEIIGLSRSEAKRQLALDCGAVDHAVDNVDAACEGCDVIVAAAPVDRIAAIANQSVAAAPDDCLVTDVGSTKATIVAGVAHRNFVAAHPIAGSEKTGVEHASADLFDEKVIIITPGSGADPEMVGRCDQFWQLTGGRTVQMSAVEHDAHLAAVSHVPHLVSALVARMLPADAASLVGSGWRDITRVAAGDPTLWTAICRENRDAIVRHLTELSGDLMKLQTLLVNEDNEGLHDWLSQAKASKQST